MENLQQNILVTDLYQITMMQAYFKEEMNDIAVFEFYTRKLSEHRNFFIAAGLEQLIDFVLNARFTESDLEFLKKDDRFTDDFLESLKEFRFTGDINAMPEGTPFFPEEPVVQVIAPIAEAQMIESRLINIMQYQTLIASKAIRCKLMAPNKTLVDYGMRRAHGSEASLYASRANYIAGFDGTATVIAGKEYGIPLYGTMAHSYVQAHDTEDVAFSTYARAQPNNVTLLIDTYDTERGAQKVAQMAAMMHEEGLEIQGVRIDSGDLGKHAIMVRATLDEADLHNVKIFASGDIDEYRLATLVKKEYPIDGFGVGTKLDTSADLPYLDCAYKLQEYAGQARRKRSEGKSTWPGRKQVYRYYDDNGIMKKDIVGSKSDTFVGAKALLEPVIKAGQRVDKPLGLSKIQAYTKEQIATLPDYLKTLTKAKQQAYEVEISQSVRELAEAVDQAMDVYSTRGF